MHSYRITRCAKISAEYWRGSDNILTVNMQLAGGKQFCTASKHVLTNVGRSSLLPLYQIFYPSSLAVVSRIRILLLSEKATDPLLWNMNGGVLKGDPIDLHRGVILHQNTMAKAIWMGMGRVFFNGMQDPSMSVINEPLVSPFTTRVFPSICCGCLCSDGRF